MTPRQRVLAALRRENPDRVPRELSFGAFTPALMKVFQERTGATDPAEYFNFEVRKINFRLPPVQPDFLRYFDRVPQNAEIDEWGVARVPGTYYHFHSFLHPMERFKSVLEIEEYPLPDYLNPSCHAHLKDEVKSLNGKGLAVSAEMACTIFEISWYMRGLENLLMDFVNDSELAVRLLERVTDLRCAQAKIYAEAGVDIICLGDDVSGQEDMMMSPVMWRKWLKPRLARVIESARSVKPDVLVFYHSDGNCTAVVPELIEIGVDILNPVQPECMDPVALKKQFGERLSFWGTIGTQSTMPFGKPEDVKGVVKERIRTVGKGGGLLLAPTHILEPEVPWENVLAFFEAIDEYGKDVSAA
jgi:uroporphyrinogen decarboxylase